MWVGKCPEQFAINFPPRVLWVSASHPCWAANYSNLVPTTSTASTASTASTRLHNLKLQDSSVLAHGDSIGVNPRLMGSKDKYEIQSRRKKTCQILQGYMPGYNIPLGASPPSLHGNHLILFNAETSLNWPKTETKYFFSLLNHICSTPGRGNIFFLFGIFFPLVPAVL